jgi:hypothetical protein
MNANSWAGLAVAVVTIIISFAGLIRWLVNHYLSELKPDSNGGHNLEGRISKIEGQISRLETRIDQIYLLLSKKSKQ